MTGTAPSLRPRSLSRGKLPRCGPALGSPARSPRWLRVSSSYPPTSARPGAPGPIATSEQRGRPGCGPAPSTPRRPASWGRIPPPHSQRPKPGNGHGSPDCDRARLLQEIGSKSNHVLPYEGQRSSPLTTSRKGLPTDTRSRRERRKGCVGRLRCCDVVIRGVNIFRITDSKIVERWGRPDDPGLLQQLGPLPPTGYRSP
jgi:hypothetical protein